ncbi:FAD-binding domain-containing protein, partial [Amylostereum chailletii]
LRDRVEGRLYAGLPLSEQCYDNFHSDQCKAIRSGYTNDTFRSQYFGAYMNTNWETCQADRGDGLDDACLLDRENLWNEDPTFPPRTCRQGSVPYYYIDVRKPEDVAAAFRYVRNTGTHLVIKNTGHDHMGRSSAPNSLALWTHNLKHTSYDLTFVPEGCTTPSPGVTVGAGVQWGEAYDFAEANNITLVGGNDKGVGVAGGWLQGGGHGGLSNTMGLGVDRVLEFKVVTPDGTYRTVNACQNQDLFFALRGGGGGTFGAVLEATMLASPPVPLQVVVLAWVDPDVKLTRTLWKTLVEHGRRWADEGWGGFVTAESAIYVSPTLSQEDAVASMRPLLQFGEGLKASGVRGATVLKLQFPSWGTFFNTFADEKAATVGTSLALASRLVPRANFATPTSRDELVEALLRAHDIAPGMRLLVSQPSTFPGVDGATSVTPAWRDAVYHVTLVRRWNWNSTQEEKRDAYEGVSSAIEHLRQITPDGVYSNEADVHEPNHEFAFWGEHCPRLLKIKRKYDPYRLLECWHCVGWDATSSRYSCYI